MRSGVIVWIGLIGVAAGSANVGRAEPPSKEPDRATILPGAAKSLTVEYGRWHAWLESPGGDLPFELEFARGTDGPQVWICNGEERLAASSVVQAGSQVVIELSFYDAALRAEVNGAGRRLAGLYSRRRNKSEWVTMIFQAEFGAVPRFPPAPAGANDGGASNLSGRWRMKFEGDEEPSIGVFAVAPDRTATGTVLTTSGDYRYLAGSFEAGRLRLSCFDGAHAFLFDAKMQPDGTLNGDFWSGAKHHERWTAVHDDAAELPDGFQPGPFDNAIRLADIEFPDTKGQAVSLGGDAYRGRAVIVELFGTWCPNCSDAGDLLGTLHATYSPRGLSVVALAFEVTGEKERDALQVERFIERHRTPYPILMAGMTDKKEASAKLPWIQSMKAYPTFLFFDRAGKLKAVYKGFYGPATGRDHERMKRELASRIEPLLQ